MDLIHSVTIEALIKRGISEETCAKFGYGLAEFKGKHVQVAPYHNAEGDVVAQKVRFADKTFTTLGSLKTAGLFGQYLWRSAGKRVVITEGEIDCLTVSQLQGNKWPVVSIPNGADGALRAVTKAMAWLEQFEEIVFCFDMDEPGRKAAIECAAAMPPGKARIARLPFKDANECHLAGHGKEVIAALWDARVYRPDGIVSGSDVLTHLLSRKNAHAATFPHAGLNLKTRGARLGEVITFAAGTGTGKTTFVREVGYHLVQQGEKLGYIALEEPVHLSSLGLCSLALNKPLRFDRDAVSDAELTAVYTEHFLDKVVFYDHWGSLDTENLLSKIRYMARSESCRYVILDHLNILTSGSDTDDERRALDIAMTKLTSIAQELNICLLLICHLKRTDGKPHEEGKPVTLSDLRGTHGIAQLSHTIIALERNQQDDEGDKNRTQLRVLKCRWTGLTGAAGFLLYDEETGRMTEVGDEFPVMATTGEARPF